MTDSLPLALVIVAAAGLVAGAFVNWCAYSLAWNRRAISPWSAPEPSAPQRSMSDRVPVVGWLGLRRESKLHGAGFWIRPLAIELLMAAAFAALYWWEVGRQGLVAGQFGALIDGGFIRPNAAGPLTVPEWTTLTTFLSHAILLTLMAAASVVDIDEKTVPSEITDWGTLVGLALAALLPTSLLPQITFRAEAPLTGVAIPGVQMAGPLHGSVLLEPTTIAAPSAFPNLLAGAPQWRGLAIGLGCYALWLFALAPRNWRTRRGRWFGLRVLISRVVRELTRPLLLWLAVIGFPAIVGCWYVGGAAWIGLLTALAGMIGASAMLWAVRIAGSLALGREALGFGDVTLMMMVGAFLGWQPGIIIFFLAPFAALIVGLLQVLLHRDNEIPYAPYLCMAAAGVVVAWARVWHEPPGGLMLLFEFPWLLIAVLAVCIVLLGGMLCVWRQIKERLL